MKYRFTILELGRIKLFLAEAIECLQKIAGEALRLKVTSGTVQARVIIYGIIAYLYTLKRHAAFFGLMEMVMLIRQTQSMLETMSDGHLAIDAVTVDVLLDAKNILVEMTREFRAVSEKLQYTEELEFELACAQEAEWLIGFIGQLIQRKTNHALVLVPQALVSKLPAIISTPLLAKKVEIESKAEGSYGDKDPNILHTIQKPVAVVISDSTMVSDEKIQRLFTLIRALSTNTHAISQLFHKLMIEDNQPALFREAKNAGQAINQVAAELEETVTAMGRVELTMIFSQFPAIVQEIGAQAGKDICLTIEGEHIAVDKSIIKQLSKLLLKIICTMAKRIEAQGHIWITAYLAGKQIVIEVEDDSENRKGADADTKVVENSDLRAAINEICQGDALPGNLEVTSLLGKGSKIRLTLPPTIIRCSGVLVEVSGQLLMVPIDHVIEIVNVTTKQLLSKRGRRLFNHRGTILGVVAVAELLEMATQQIDDSIPVLIVTNGQDKIGLLVGKVHNEQEFIPKSLPDYLGDSEYIGGAAITNDGKVALILNILALIKKMSVSHCHNSIKN